MVVGINNFYPNFKSKKKSETIKIEHHEHPIYDLFHIFLVSPFFVNYFSTYGL